jgi:hypothetical protein
MTSTAYIESENEMESSPSMNTSHLARQDSLDFSACSKSSRLSPAPFKSSWLSGPCYLHGSRPSAVRAERSVPSLTLLAVTNSLFCSLARDSDQFMPRGRPFAARDIVGEVRRRQLRPCFFNRCNDAPLRLYFVSARK